MLGYHAERFPVSIRVQVTFYEPGNMFYQTFEDGIRGLNVGHAIWRARWNWQDAEIEYLGLAS